MKQVEIVDVRLETLPQERVRLFSLDSPVRGLKVPDGNLPIGGWLLEAAHHVTGVVLFCQGTIMRSSRLTISRPDVAAQFPGTGNCGFAMSLPAWMLPPEFEIEIFAVYRDPKLVKLATIQGKHDCTAIASPNALQPLLMTSLGRTGTTHLMQLLAHHPQIVAERLYPYEANAARYWMHLLRVLTRPEHNNPAEPFDRGNTVQPEFTGLPIHTTPAMAAYLQGSYPDLVARFCCDAIDGFYRDLAARQQQPPPAYFCEKLVPSALCFMFHNLYPGTREIFLVRDFRDVLASIFAFNAKRGVLAFGREQIKSDERYILEQQRAARGLLDSYHGRREHAHLVRYEDLVLRPRHALGVILRFLDLDAGSAAVDHMIRHDAAASALLEKHQTSSSPRDSIGRWKRDLDPALIPLARAAFDGLLPEMGYELDADGNLVLGESEPAPTPEPSARYAVSPDT